MEQLMINTGDSELEVSTKKYFLFQCNYILVCHCARAPRHCALLKVVFDCRFCNRMASTTCLAVSVHIESALYKCLLQTASSPFSVNRAGELITKTSSARLERANERQGNSVCITFTRSPLAARRSDLRSRIFSPARLSREGLLAVYKLNWHNNKIR